MCIALCLIYFPYSTYVSHGVVHRFHFTILPQASRKFSTDQPRGNGMDCDKWREKIWSSGWYNLWYNYENYRHNTNRSYSQWPWLWNPLPSAPPSVSAVTACMLCSRVEENVWPSRFQRGNTMPSHAEKKKITKNNYYISNISLDPRSQAELPLKMGLVSTAAPPETWDFG